VVAVGWPKTVSGAGGVEILLETDAVAEPALRQRLAARLPSYMVPRGVHCLPKFPLNSNGKYDRIALTRILEEKS
jgi:acyl-coenzyme A synthetase/AMP-(fatty) acid ligase